jgi:hypothetical protein
MRMVIAWPTTAPQRNRTIQRRLMRGAGSTAMRIQRALVPKSASQMGKVMLKFVSAMTRGS